MLAIVGFMLQHYIEAIKDTVNLKWTIFSRLFYLISMSFGLKLQDPDDSLKRKTFELLYKMTKSSNVEVIVDRMIDYMININDSHYKTEIASRCVELAEQYAPSNQWFIQVQTCSYSLCLQLIQHLIILTVVFSLQTMNKVFEHAGDLVNIKVVHNLMRLIAEGFGEEDDIVDGQLRLSAVGFYN